MNNFLSIIIPVYNAGLSLRKCLESIFYQNIINYEIILIDGKSTDNTIKIAKQFQNKIKIISEKDNGIYDAMNKGIKQAKGKWLYFLGADDLLLPNVLEKIFRNRENLNSYDMIYGNVLRVPSNVIYDGEFNLKKLFTKNICHQAIFYKKYLFSQIGYFNASYKSRADYALNIKIFSNGFKTHHVPITIAKFNDEGLSSNYFDWKFWEDYKTNYIKPFKHVISKTRRYNILWKYFFYLVDQKHIFLSFKLLLVISFNEVNVKNSYQGIKYLLANLIKVKK